MPRLNSLPSPEGQPDLIVWDGFGLGLLWSYHCFSYCAFQTASLILALADGRWPLCSPWQAVPSIPFSYS